MFLQGEGAGLSVLYFPKPLQDIYGNTYAGGVSQYSFGPGFINFNGADFPSSNTLLAAVSSSADMGSNTLTINTVAGIQPGQVSNGHGCSKTNNRSGYMEPGCWTGQGFLLAAPQQAPG